MFRRLAVTAPKPKLHFFKGSLVPIPQDFPSLSLPLTKSWSCPPRLCMLTSCIMYLLLIFIALCAHTLLASPIDLSLDDVLNRRSPIGATPNHAITQGSPGPQGPGAKAPTCSGDSKIPYDQSCWDTLQLSAWLDNWNKTTPTCDANGGNGTDCCGPANNPDEPWTTCFLRLALGNSDYDCTQINDQACSLEGFQLNPDYLPSQRAQVRYIVRNIYCKIFF